MRDFKVYQASGLLNFLVSEATDVRKKEQTLTGNIISFVADEQTAVKIVANIDSETGLTGCNIWHTGTNLCDLADAGIGTKSLYNLSSGTISIGGSGATLSGTNPIEITNTTTWRGAVFFSKPMKSGQQCKIRYRITGTSPSNIKRTTYIVDESNAIVSKVNYSASPGHDVDYVYTQNVTAVSDGDKAVFAVESANQQTITIYDLSFNYPSTDTSYHAYSGTTYPISWQTEAGTITDGTLTIDYDGSVTLKTGGQTYTLTSISPIETLIGDNNIWSDAGPVSVTYPI